MIISKDSNNNWTPVATGNGTFIGTKTAFDAVKDDLPDNTVAYTTDDGESVTDEITDGDMRAVTSNAVYDELNTITTNVLTITNLAAGVTIMELESCRLGKLVDFKFRLHIPAGLAANTDIVVGKVNLKPVITERFMYQIAPYFDSWISTDGNIHIFMDSELATGGIKPFFSHPYLTND